MENEIWWDDKEELELYVTEAIRYHLSTGKLITEALEELKKKFTNREISLILKDCV